jgi:hypothetical protein
MHKYHYQICTIPINEKHLVRKIVYSNEGEYLKHEENKFTYIQIDKLLKKIDIDEYTNIEGALIHTKPPQKLDEIIDISESFENKNMENFISGNFSYP